MCQNSHFPIFNHARGWLSNFNHARGWEMTMRQKLTMCVVEFLAHFHVRVRECARTGTFLLLTYKEKSLIIPLYKAIVRPHLEYYIQAWNPHLRKDVDMLDKIQRRATKLIPELRDLTYEERLKECGLTTLETRILRTGEETK